MVIKVQSFLMTSIYGHQRPKPVDEVYYMVIIDQNVLMRSIYGHQRPRILDEVYVWSSKAKTSW